MPTATSLLKATLLTRALAFVTADLPESQVAFADELTSRLQSDTSKNQFSSSLGVSMMFSLLYPSMEGESKSQTENVLGFDAGNESTLPWASTVAAFNANYSGACIDEFEGECFQSQPIVSVSNAVWVNTGSTLNPEYESVVGDIVQETDFDAPEAGDLVNSWVEEATRGLIPTIVESGPLSPWILLATNVIYFKANWMLPFAEFHTTKDKFYTSDRLSVTREDTIFMHKVERHPYSDTAIPGFQMVALPFVAGPALSMVLVQPTSPTDSMVTSAQVISALPEVTTSDGQFPRVALALPRFEMEASYTDDLKTALMDLGLTAPFEGNLCVYENDCSPYIDVVLQKTFISVDEKGVEAAAATFGAVATSFPVDAPIEFLANGPFQFFIYDADTDVVLFEGRVVDPTPHENAPDAPVGNHSDPMFWFDKFGVEPVKVFDATNVDSATVSECPTVQIMRLLVGVLFASTLCML